jgi:putative tryptophan/tyrosine transport system substrate-binding protein
VRRREFIAGLGGAAAWPVVAQAQQPAMPVIGYLGLGSRQDADLTLFRQGLSDAGYREGQNVAIEYRWADGVYERMPDFAAEFVRRPVTIIFASNTTAAIAAKNATSTLPIVFIMGGGDPVALGLASSINRPGRNATGVIQLTAAVETKVFGLLRQLVPNARLIVALVNPKSAQRQMQDLQQAASSLGVEFDVLRASNPSEIDEAFRMLAARQPGALIVVANVFFSLRRHQITTLAAHYRIPAIYQTSDFVEADGLMIYTIVDAGLTRQAGIYVGRILKGENPADLPIVQPTKFELVINLKTARALGLTIPETLLATADQVIQ